MMTLDTSLDIKSIHSVSLFDGVCGRANTLLDVLLLDEDDVNSHFFEASSVSLSMESMSKGVALQEGYSFRSFNGSDLESSELTNSSNSFFNVKEKSDRRMPSRRVAKILFLEGSKSKEFIDQPTNNLLGILEGSSTYEFTPELISPKRIANATIGCEHRDTRQVNRKSVISMILLQNECKQHQHVIDDNTEVLQEEEIPIIKYHSPSTKKYNTKFNNMNKSKLDSKRKQRDSPKSASSKQSSSNIHRQSKRGMSEESRTSTSLIGNDNFHEDSTYKNNLTTLKRHEKCVSPANKKNSITKANKNNLSPSLDDFLANSNQRKDKVSMKPYVLKTADQTISVSSVSYASIDSNDIMSPKLMYELIPLLSNSFPSPKIDSTNRKKLSIHNRDINRSVSTSIFNSLSSSWQTQQRSDDSAPKQPRRCQSPPRDVR